MSTNIRVFVEWKEPSVFAGEDIECTITFKNVSAVRRAERSPIRPTKQNGFAAGGERQRKVAPLTNPTRPPLSRNSSAASQLPPLHLRGHRPALSLTTPSIGGPASYPPTGSVASYNGAPGGNRRHGRSLSIMSIGTDASSDVNSKRSMGPPPRRPARGHGRSASLQVIPGTGRGGIGSPFSPPLGSRAVTTPSPLSGNSFTFPDIPDDPAARPRHTRHASAAVTASGTPSLPIQTRKPSGSFSQSFKFPMAPPPPGHTPSLPNHSPSLESTATMESLSSPRIRTPQIRGHSPRLLEESSGPNDSLSPVARILSGSSMTGTPRSSGEFYSMSNNSTETLASEYLPHPSVRLAPNSVHLRLPSQGVPPTPPKAPETLMMGYAQIMGSFTVDGSLINQAPFEEVKRKGVVGGQGGGGVVGVERTKRESGLFGALGWGNLGESLGGLLGGGELSSIKEMRGIASSKTVPLITTPQSILFVDLRLGPGESRSYKYSFTLPRGLPPTHKGRAMKVEYHLTIGTQRPGSKREQQMRHVEVPFRVFGSVTSRGEILGHDLMSPYIILRDQARTRCLDDPSETPNGAKKANGDAGSKDGFLEFHEYVTKLLDRPRENSSLGLLSPTDHGSRRTSSFLGPEEPQTMKEAIDLAILRSNITSHGNQSANRFEIARSGRRVATIMLSRPAYRLGESITTVVDFTNTDIPCYSLHVALESSEKVDPAIALRSNASIYRVTRKTHAAFVENALFAQRLAFAPTVPPTATPEFITSGVSLEWKLRVEFVTPRLTHEDGQEASWGELLEVVEQDERGVILAGAERLPCESFEVAVPVRVYGAATGSTEVADVEGLVV